jgi:hypothetical protein
MKSKKPKNQAKQKNTTLCIKRIRVTKDMADKFYQTASKLGLSLRKTAFILNVSTTYLSNILDGKLVSQHSVTIFTLLIEYLKSVDFHKKRQCNESFSQYTERQTIAVDRMKLEFTNYLNSISFNSSGL